MDTTHNKGNDMSDKITLQKIFDLAWQAFIIEDKPPSCGRIACLYQDAYGNRCAVGLSLPNYHNALMYEGGFEGLVDGYPELFDEQIQELANLIFKGSLNKFQARLHDHWVDIETREWKGTKQERMEDYLKIAEELKLTIPAARPTQTTDH
jgi:hypothetical protein